MICSLISWLWRLSDERVSALLLLTEKPEEEIDHKDQELEATEAAAERHFGGVGVSTG